MAGTKPGLRGFKQHFGLRRGGSPVDTAQVAASMQRDRRHRLDRRAMRPDSKTRPNGGAADAGVGRPYVWLDLGPASRPFTLTVTRHARARAARRVANLALPFVRQMVELSMRHKTYLPSIRRRDQVFIPVWSDAVEPLDGWLCGTFEPAIRSEAAGHIEVVTCFGDNYLHVIEALRPLDDHPCPTRVLVDAAESVPYLGGPHRALEDDLRRRYPGSGGSRR
jgi:hypothetical protein